MFEFLKDLENYDERKIDAFYGEDGKLFVSTARVSDGDRPFETLVRHEDYEPGEAVVEAYDTVEDAKIGHAKWVEIMVTNAPTEIPDCGNSKISQLAHALSDVRVMRLRKK